MSVEKPQLLLIDDDEIDRELLYRLLGETYTIKEAINGNAGIQAVAAQRPHLVLLDYYLPDIDSLELLRMFVAEAIPVIVLTGEERPDVIVQAMQDGAQDYLIKGQLTRDSLQRAITHGLEKAELKRSVALQQQQIVLQAEAMAEQNRQIRTLASALALAEQRERKRVAQILHDHLQQLLYGVQMRLHLLTTDLVDNVPSPVLENLQESAKLLTDAIEATRSLSVDLSPPVLKDEGIHIALQWLAAHMERIHGLVVELQLSEGFDYVVESEDIYILLFQLVRELLFNVIKHANVKAARVRLFTEAGRQKITVEDEGVGFEMGHVVQPKWNPQQGYGLYSVRERLALFGGKLDIDTRPGNGAKITIVLPKQVAAT